MNMNRLKEVRKSKELTLNDVEEKTGIKNNTLSQYENGKREPKLETWRKLAKFYDVPAPYLQGITFSKYDIYKILNDEYLSNTELTLVVIRYLAYANIDTPDILFNKKELLNFDKKVQEYWKNNFNFIFSFQRITGLLYMDKRSKYPFEIDKRLISVIDKKTLEITETPISKAFDDITKEKEYCLKYFWLDRDEINRFNSKKKINKYVDEAIKELTEFKKALKDLPDNKRCFKD